MSCNRIVTASLKHILEGTRARCDFLQLPCFPPVTEVAETLVWLATTATLSPGGQGEQSFKSPRITELRPPVSGLLFPLSSEAS